MWSSSLGKSKKSYLKVIICSNFDSFFKFGLVKNLNTTWTLSVATQNETFWNVSGINAIKKITSTTCNSNRFTSKNCFSESVKFLKPIKDENVLLNLINLGKKCKANWNWFGRADQTRCSFALTRTDRINQKFIARWYS